MKTLLFESDRSTRLGRGQSYPIKAQALDAALRKGGVDIALRVKWLRRHESHGASLVLRAMYDGLEARQAAGHVNRPGAVTLAIFSVPSEERADVEKVLLEHGLSRLASWLAEIVDRPETWRTEPHDLTISIAGGALKVAEETPRPPWARVPEPS